MARETVRVFEVGVRDGLQNEKALVSTARKITLIRGLLDAGIRDFELGAFVRPDRVPQMADTERLYAALHDRSWRLGRARAWSLVANETGLRRAIKAGARNIAIFTAATDTFARRNIGMSVKQSLQQFSRIVPEAHRRGMEVRGYVSTAFGCPFEGKVRPSRALKVVEALLGLGVSQVSIGDTIGVATPRDIEAVMRPALGLAPQEKLAGHYHDTRGTALANALRSIELGIRTLDSSAGGLGGCPFAPGAAGNLATEDLVYMLEGMGLRTGIDLDAVARLSVGFSRFLRKPPASRYVAAFAASCDRSRSRKR